MAQSPVRTPVVATFGGAGIQDDEGLVSDLPRGDPEKGPEKYAAPEARYMKLSAIRDEPSAHWQPGMMFLGVIDGQRTGIAPDHYIMGGLPVGVGDNRHMITVAGSRAGKGRSAIVPNMLHYPGSVLATDPKGELATFTARHRKEGLKQDVYVLDPFGVAVGYPHQNKLVTGFNPIEVMRPDKLVEDAALIADALVVIEVKDPHWDESARAFIEGLILHVRTSADYEGKRSLLTVRDLAGQALGAPGDALALKMRGNQAADGIIQSAAADFFDRPTNEKGSVLSSVRRHLKFIDLFRSEIGKLTLEKNGFNLNALKTRPTTIYLCLPARHIAICNRWLRLFVNLTLQGMERTPGPPPKGVPVLCVLDEFAALGHMSQIESAAGQIAGFGVKLWPILQDLGQLQALYKERWETFMGNAGVLQFFGNNDLTTLEWISKRCGKTAIRVRTNRAVTIQQTDSGLPGENWSTEVHDLLGIHEVAQYFRRDDRHLRQLVIWGGLPPLVLQRVNYDQHRLFKDQAGNPLFDDPPPVKAAVTGGQA